MSLPQLRQEPYLAPDSPYQDPEEPYSLLLWTTKTLIPVIFMYFSNKALGFEEGRICLKHHLSSTSTCDPQNLQGLGCMHLMTSEYAQFVHLEPLHALHDGCMYSMHLIYRLHVSLHWKYMCFLNITIILGIEFILYIETSRSCILQPINVATFVLFWLILYY